MSLSFLSLEGDDKRRGISGEETELWGGVGGEEVGREVVSEEEDRGRNISGEVLVGKKLGWREENSGEEMCGKEEEGKWGGVCGEEMWVGDEGEGGNV